MTADPNELESGMWNYVRAQDAEKPDRICAWCFHPRNSAECLFAANHPAYFEMFGRQ